MKKLITYIAGTIVLVAVLDFLAGAGMRKYLSGHRLPGDCASIDYTIKDIDEDVVILGNSVILNSLMPQILSDSLGLSVYNSASNGQEIDFFYSLLDCILKRHTPKAIIMGARDDLFTTTGIGDRYSILSPYYGMGYEVIDSCLNNSGEHSELFMKSTFYRYNTIWWRISLYHFISPNEKGVNGFIAKPIPPMPPKLLDVADDNEPQAARLATLNTIIDRCQERGIELILIYPPLYYNRQGESKAATSVRKLCAERRVTVIDNSADSYFLQHPELFYDNTHLNINGAEIFSRQKAFELKQILSGQSKPD